MPRNRILPEQCYDFWAHDWRDGEEGPRRSTMKAAKADARIMRAPLEWYRRCVIEVQWAVNERKVLAMLTRKKVRA